MRPILLRLGPLTIRSYGFLLALGSALAIWRASRLSKKAGMTPSQVLDIGLLCVVAGLIGARLLYVLLNLSYYRSNPVEIPAVWDGGLTFLGGLIVGAAAGVIYTKKAGLDTAAVADLVAPSLALGYAIARIGCFLNGCCYGAPAALPWAVRFHADGGAALTPPSHPVQLYSSALSFLIFGLLVVLERRKLPAGSLFGSWLALASIERYYMEEFRRGATAQVFWGQLTQAQAASLVLLAAGIVIIIISRRKRSASAGPV